MTTNRRIAAVLALGLSLTNLTPLLAQEQPLLRAKAPIVAPDTLVGWRVRIERRVGEQGTSRLQGRVIGMEPDHLLVQVEGTSAEDVEVPLVQVVRLQIHTDTHRATRRGAALGALLGVGVAVALVNLSSDSDEICEGSQPCGHILTAAVATALGGVGGGLGAAVGAASRVEDWDVVARPRAWPAVAVVPQKGGARVALAFRF